VPLVHVAGDPTQVAPHAPQLFGSVCSLTHELPHFVKPELHAIPHTPPLQVALPFEGTVQLLVHDPQCVGSVPFTYVSQPSY
jgi:hypothetical protein